jgi:hypothetical protein
MGTVDDYFGTLDAETQSAFERIRTLALEIVPQTDQGSSYGMAALKFTGRWTNRSLPGIVPRLPMW